MLVNFITSTTFFGLLLYFGKFIEFDEKEILETPELKIEETPELISTDEEIPTRTTRRPRNIVPPPPSPRRARHGPGYKTPDSPGNLRSPRNWS